MEDEKNIEDAPASSFDGKEDEHENSGANTKKGFRVFFWHSMCAERKAGRRVCLWNEVCFCR